MSATDLRDMIVLLLLNFVEAPLVWMFWFRPEQARKNALEIYEHSKVLDLFGINYLIVRSPIWIWVSRFASVFVLIMTNLMLATMIRRAIDAW